MMRLRKAVDLYLNDIDNPRTRWSVYGVLIPLARTLNQDMDVSEISPTALHEYIQSMKNSTLKYVAHSRRPNEIGQLSPVTINNRVKTIKRFFKWLVEIEELEASPAKSLKTKRFGSRIDPDRLPTHEEIDQLLRFFFGKRRDYALLRFLVDTGCRVGAAAKVRVQDIDTVSQEAMVMDEKGDRWYIAYFSDGTARAIDEWIEDRPAWEHDYVFATKRGHLQPGSITQKWRRACDRLGIRRMKSHDFRHKKGMDMAEMNIHHVKMAKVFGHRDGGKTACESYSHLRDRSVRRAAMRTHRHRPGDLPDGNGRILYFPGVG